MRILTEQQIHEELRARQCEKIAGDHNGTYWKAPEGGVFQVPVLEDGYPEWMLDDLIERHQLPPGTGGDIR